MQQALADYDQMREREGAKLRTDVEEKLARIESLVTSGDGCPETAAACRARLRQKLETVLAATDIDESRIIAEAAIYADHVAVDEETVRLAQPYCATAPDARADPLVGCKADSHSGVQPRGEHHRLQNCQNADIAKVVVDQVRRSRRSASRSRTSSKERRA